MIPEPNRRAAILLPVPTDPPPEDGVLRHLGLERCVRLSLRIDAERLAGELDRLPADVWGRAERDPVVHASVESFFAVGYPRGPKPLPADDRPALAMLPYLGELLHQVIPASPTRAIVARLSPRGLIPIHTDTPRYFRGTVRLSIQVDADGPQRLYCDGLWYEVAPGEVWALDNLRPHGVFNPGIRPRTNVIVDCLPSSELVALVTAGDDTLGATDEHAREEIEALTRERYRSRRWQAIRYEIGKRWRRRRWLGGG